MLRNTQHLKSIEQIHDGYAIVYPSYNRGNTMGIQVGLIEQQSPCAGCETIDERWTIVIEKNVTNVDEICLSCACQLHSKLQKLLREIPTIKENQNEKANEQ